MGEDQGKAVGGRLELGELAQKHLLRLVALRAKVVQDLDVLDPKVVAGVRRARAEEGALVYLVEPDDVVLDQPGHVADVAAVLDKQRLVDGHQQLAGPVSDRLLAHAPRERGGGGGGVGRLPGGVAPRRPLLARGHRRGEAAGGHQQEEEEEGGN